MTIPVAWLQTMTEQESRRLRSSRRMDVTPKTINSKASERSAAQIWGFAQLHPGRVTEDHNTEVDPTCQALQNPQVLSLDPTSHHGVCYGHMSTVDLAVVGNGM